MTRKAYLIHGTSTRDDDWFPWLEQVLKPAIELDRIFLPDPFAPDRTAWDGAVDDQLPHDGAVTVVAHSLGCVTALRYAARTPLTQVNLVLVGAFDQPLPTYPQLDQFMKGKVDYDAIKQKLGKATVITAQNDPIAPYQYGVSVANHLGAKLIVRPDGGHFLSSDGYTQFPLVEKELQRVMQ
ncbi:RBBP9/YdeN family alpha/beta hydrolase [Limosilactobacillus secaliphilus]|uniref:Esterase n=1 Tax=Limosilactobacillus secaliphilus TaxID=396268 RepID=A0A0R2I0V1_9LACO|nr:alpha/beta hydrolase [Limosilactobacillus secaliphilus]KRN58648.1 hypothetical protein IV45_GL001100 [Limosilactobacillus secaliphilus]